MKRFSSLSSKVLMGFLCVFFLFAGVASAGVKVYGECAYTDADLVCNIYVDTDSNTLLSGGVALSYATSKLSDPSTVPADEKIVRNEAEWYFGEPDGTKHPYPAPELDTTDSNSHKVVCIVGKLRESNTTEGVNSSRSLMVKVTFARTESAGDPGHGADAAAYFGLDLAVGRSAPFDNFVTTNTPPDVLDGGIDFRHPDSTVEPYFPIQVAKRGDANASGTINSTDYVAIRNNLTAEYPPPYADCNGNGVVNSTDYVCVRNIILGL